MPDVAHDQDGLFEQVMSSYGDALERLARAYEADAEVRRDLLQEIHIALWRSLAGFDKRCALRTWVYRVAHNVAASHVDKQVRARKGTFVSLDELEGRADSRAGVADTEQRHALGQLYAMIHELKPLDRQVMLAYLEGIDAASTAEITGLSAQNVATKIHRIKGALASGFGKEAVVNNEFPEDRQVMELWQSQKTEGVRMSVEQVRLEAGRFQRKISARNLREYVVAIVLIIYFGFEFSRITQVVARVGFGLLIAGIAYLVWHMLSKGSPGTIDEAAGLLGSIEFRRRELVRQRDLLRSVWRWYIGPCIPGLAVLVAWFVYGNRSKPAVVLMAAVYVLVVAAGFWWMGRLNAKGADKLQRQIDELDEQSR